MSLENKLLTFIANNGNFISQNDLDMTCLVLETDKHELENALKLLIKTHKINEIFINPSTNQATSQKDLEHYEKGFCLAYKKAKIKDVLTH